MRNILFLLFILIGCTSMDAPSPVAESQVAWMDSEPEEEMDVLFNALVEGQPLKYLVIHCTATVPSNTWGPEELTAFFKHIRGWSRPGYMLYVTYDGRIHPLWPANIDGVVEHGERTWGAQGYNSVSMHIAYQGGVDRNNSPKDTRTMAQKKSLESIVKVVRNAVPTVEVVGHRSLSDKACPSFDVSSEY